MKPAKAFELERFMMTCFPFSSLWRSWEECPCYHLHRRARCHSSQERQGGSVGKCLYHENVPMWCLCHIIAHFCMHFWPLKVTRVMYACMNTNRTTHACLVSDHIHALVCLDPRWGWASYCVPTADTHGRPEAAKSCDHHGSHQPSKQHRPGSQAIRKVSWMCEMFIDSC